MIVIRIILGVLAVILGLIVLVLLILLFLPVGYEIEGRKEQDDIEGGVYVHAVLKAIRFKAQLTKMDSEELRVSVGLGILWIRKTLMDTQEEKEAGAEESETRAAESSEKPEEPKESEAAKAFEETEEPESPEESSGEEENEQPEPGGLSLEADVMQEEEAFGTEEEESETETPQEEQPKTAQEDEQRMDAAGEEIWIQGLYSDQPYTFDITKLTAFLEKVLISLKKKLSPALDQAARMKQKPVRLLQKIRQLIRRIQKIEQTVWEDPDRTYLMHLLGRQLKKIFRGILPRRGRGYIRYGFDDPSTTGMLTGALYAGEGFTGGMRHVRIDIVPEFEEACVEGKLYLKGRVQGYMIIFPLVRIALDRKVWKYVGKIRRISL